MTDQERIEQLEQRAARLEARLTEHKATMQRVEIRLTQVEARHQELMALLGMTSTGTGLPITLNGLLGAMAKARLN